MFIFCSLMYFTFPTKYVWKDQFTQSYINKKNVKDQSGKQSQDVTFYPRFLSLDRPQQWLN